MAPQEFPLRKGSIQFETDRIVIQDNVRFTHNLMFVSSIIWLVFGVSKIYKFNSSGDRFDLILGILILLCHMGVIVMFSRRSIAKTIDIQNIEAIQVRQNLASKYLQIRLKNGKVRRVDNLAGNTKSLEFFVRSYMTNISPQTAQL